jgi:exonuclease VII large subunit
MHSQKQHVLRNSEWIKIQLQNFNQKERVQLSFLQKQLTFWNTNQKPRLIANLIQSQQNLMFCAKNHLKNELQKTKEKEQVVNLLDPKNILKRGYAIPLFNGKIIDLHQLPEINDEIELITYCHIFKTKITKIDKNEE